MIFAELVIFCCRRVIIELATGTLIIFDVARLFAGRFNFLYKSRSVCMTERCLDDISAGCADLSRCFRCFCARYMSRFILLCVADGALVPMVCLIA